MMIRFVCDGVITEMDKFYDTKTEAELLFHYYLKMDAIKSGTSNSLGKFLGL
jgi:hypothetical protein